MRTLLLTIALLPTTALAGDLSVGIGAGVAMDLGDAVSRTYNTPTDFGPGPSLLIPIRYALSDRAHLRATLRTDAGWGNDRVTWSQTIEGEEFRYYSDSHWSMLVGKALTIGADATLASGKVSPYLGAEMGPAHVTTYHSFGPESDTGVLLDPSQNDLDSSGNIDPYSGQFTWLTDLHLGATMAAGEGGTSLWVEGGYGLAYVREAPLKKTPADLDATREAYGWNPVRLGVGVSFAL